MLQLDKLYEGVVEGLDDPFQLGAVQVRVFGIHTESLSDLPVPLLPWAYPIGDITSAGISGIGSSPVGIVKGTKVLLIPFDESLQQFYILGTLPGYSKTFLGTNGFNDPDGMYPIPNYGGNGNDVNLLSRDNIGIVSGSSSDPLANITGNTTTTTVDSYGAANPPSTISQADIDKAPWMPVALSQLGISYSSNPDVVKKYTATCGISNDGFVNWCSGFANYCMKQVSITGTRSAAARSWLSWGSAIDYSNVSKIPYGAVFVIPRPPNPSSGHVGFFMKDNGNGYFTAINGNSGSQPGGIVKYSNYKYSDLLGMRWPKAQ